MTEDVPAIPAATVIVMRERAGHAPDLLFVERAQAMVFAAGALVFPGGRVDPADRALAATLSFADRDEAAHRIAAVRETIEETGIVLGLVPSSTGEPSVNVPDLDVLVPFARWLPRGVPHRVFDTRFYLARLPVDAPDPVVDAAENARAFWASADAVLAMAAAGEAKLIFPTRRILERLARYASHDDAIADAARYPARVVTPWIEERDGVAHLCIPNDLGYPVTAEPLASAQRA